MEIISPLLLTLVALLIAVLGFSIRSDAATRAANKADEASLEALDARVRAKEAMALANEALIEIKAMQRSTHQVQFVPADSLLGDLTDEELGDAAGKIEHDQFEKIDDIIRDSDALI
jgi:hypothetical protein